LTLTHRGDRRNYEVAPRNSKNIKDKVLNRQKKKRKEKAMSDAPIVL